MARAQLNMATITVLMAAPEPISSTTKVVVAAAEVLPAVVVVAEVAALVTAGGGMGYAQIGRLCNKDGKAVKKKYLKSMQRLKSGVYPIWGGSKPISPQTTAFGPSTSLVRRFTMAPSTAMVSTMTTAIAPACFPPA